MTEILASFSLDPFWEGEQTVPRLWPCDTFQRIPKRTKIFFLSSSSFSCISTFKFIFGYFFFLKRIERKTGTAEHVFQLSDAPIGSRFLFRKFRTCRSSPTIGEYVEELGKYKQLKVKEKKKRGRQRLDRNVHNIRNRKKKKRETGRNGRERARLNKQYTEECHCYNLGDNICAPGNIYIGKADIIQDRGVGTRRRKETYPE